MTVFATASMVGTSVNDFVVVTMARDKLLLATVIIDHDKMTKNVIWMDQG